MKSQPQMHYLMYRRMEKADTHVDNTCCLIHLFFVQIKKIFKPLYCGIINILSGSIWMDFLGTHSQLIMNLFILHTGIHKITPPQTF